MWFLVSEYTVLLDIWSCSPLPSRKEGWVALCSTMTPKTHCCFILVYKHILWVSWGTNSHSYFHGFDSVLSSLLGTSLQLPYLQVFSLLFSLSPLHLAQEHTNTQVSSTFEIKSHSLHIVLYMNLIVGFFLTLIAYFFFLFCSLLNHMHFCKLSEIFFWNIWI